MSYTDFAQYYDGLMQNAGYPERAEYLCALLRHFHPRADDNLFRKNKAFLRQIECLNPYPPESQHETYLFLIL